jgi:lysosomal Pro-X carboxypeptidase
LTPSYDWALDYFGGRWPAADFEYSSNIIFSNGDIDPWSGGGIMTNITTNNIALVIEDGAHHLDLRLPEPETDPYSVKVARATEYAYIKRWCEDYQMQEIYDTSEMS